MSRSILKVVAPARWSRHIFSGTRRGYSVKDIADIKFMKADLQCKYPGIADEPFMTNMPGWLVIPDYGHPDEKHAVYLYTVEDDFIPEEETDTEEVARVDPFVLAQIH
jgi:hypothetical protein